MSDSESVAGACAACLDGLTGDHLSSVVVGVVVWVLLRVFPLVLTLFRRKPKGGSDGER